MKIARKFSTQSVYIVAAKRTPVGSLMGKLSQFKATELSSLTIKAALESKQISPENVDEAIFGNVCSAGLGQNPARQAILGAGLPITTIATNVNKVCSSGMKAVSFAAQQIQLGAANCIISGGFESMSNVPFYVMNYRKGILYGNQQLLDGLATDGLSDVYNKCAMGVCAEKTAQDFQISRQLQDDFCISSYERALQAAKQGKFNEEIVPVKLNDKETFSQDEEPQKFRKEKIPLLKPAFSKTGTITAANSSKINDGACSLVLMSEKKIKELNIKPLAKIISFADAEVDPIDFCIAPTKAAQKALVLAGMKQQQIEFYEFSEAFAVTALCNMKLFDIDPIKINVNGGAVALGHPIGMSGARLVQSLVSVLKQNKGKYGVASICNGGGGASAIIIENL
ncbi:hypothetical protein IMG5_004260 [Ichthyophthirius multifiliis]|uniref:acetyl-CoA C-acetyltransferase n=1 Tax=Ichthyophthirius multifiliis TaxID=5932 RepID=G0QJD8_ICHMU|nr:hypothetical protein IMG5_004260 [Ichthyophthirius multifiliis]EGR34678.1 hypothetical protein IMG5_004260 [Ichthyophthirius multifiliis]|eukprot:XP_004039982.1 hypothetical protein IMG5_004260 [Ichthyophthirius multifiliis]